MIPVLEGSDWKEEGYVWYEQVRLLNIFNYSFYIKATNDKKTNYQIRMIKNHIFSQNPSGNNLRQWFSASVSRFLTFESSKPVV
jgi:hypothetical protein